MTDKPTRSPILDARACALGAGDLPTGRDTLDFQPYAGALSDILLDPNTHTPLTLHVFGRWGSGRTSLMRLIRARGAGRTTRYRIAQPGTSLPDSLPDSCPPVATGWMAGVDAIVAEHRAFAGVRGADRER